MGGRTIIVVSFLIYWGWYIYNGFEIGKKVTPTPHSCKAFRGPLGAEDLIKWRGMVLASNVDSTALWSWPNKQNPSVSDPTAAQPGAIWVLKNMGTPQVTFEKVDMVGYPAGVAFHPHGLGLLDKEDLLFVINHAYSNGGERVDDEPNKVQLRYQSTVNFAQKFYGVTNDVVPISNKEFYVTRYLPLGDTEYGRPTGLFHKLLTTFYLINPFNLKLTEIYHCKDVSGKSDNLCKPVGPLGAMWNGITYNAKDNVLYVLDVLENTLAAFTPQKDGSLQEVKRYKLGHRGDNVNYDPEDGKIYYGGLAQLFGGFVQWVGDYEHHVGKTPKGGASPSGYKSTGHASALDLTTGRVTTLVLHDGGLLGGVSVGIKVGNQVVLGSFVDDGILVCDLS